MIRLLTFSLALASVIRKVKRRADGMVGLVSWDFLFAERLTTLR